MCVCVWGGGGGGGGGIIKTKILFSVHVLTHCVCTIFDNTYELKPPQHCNKQE